MKRMTLSAIGGLTLAVAQIAAPAPLLAQETDPSAAEIDAAMAQLSGMFTVDPLTDEQQERLPQAARIIDRMIPEGTLPEMMGSMFERRV